MADVLEPPAKRVKLTELPISATQRAAVTSILHSYKKKGSFDALRKSVYAAYETSPAKTSLTDALTQFGEEEIERNPKLLGKDRRQAAPLIEGAAERGGIYKSTEAEIEQLVDRLLGNAESELHEIRCLDIGDEAANREVRKGAKTDEDYAAEAGNRRKERAKAREAEVKLQRQKELEALRKREEELKRQRDEDEKKAKERETVRQKAEELKRERDKELKERAERKRRQDEQWAAERYAEEERQRKAREKEREKEIEDMALEELLRQGAQAAARKVKAVPDAPSPSPRKDVRTSSASKESAIEAIMRREKQENRRKLSEGDIDTVALERHDSTTSRRLLPRNSHVAPSPIPVATTPRSTEASRSESSRPPDDHQSRDRHASAHSHDHSRLKPYNDEYSHPSYKRSSHDHNYRSSRHPDYDRGYDGSYDYDRRHSSKYHREDHGYRDDGYARPRHHSSRDYPPPRDRESHESSHHSSHRHQSYDQRPRSRSPKPPSRGSDGRLQEQQDKNTPAEIDRYVPSTSSRATEPNRSAKSKIYDRAANEERGGRNERRERSTSREKRNRSRSREKRRRSRSSRS